MASTSWYEDAPVVGGDSSDWFESIPKVDAEREKKLRAAVASASPLEQVLQEEQQARTAETLRSNPFLAGNEAGAIATGALSTVGNMAATAARPFSPSLATGMTHAVNAIGQAQQMNVADANMSGVRKGVNQLLPGVAESVIQSTVLGPLGLPALLAGIGATTFNKEYVAGRDRGLSPDKATQHAVEMTLAETVPEAVGAKLGAGSLTRAFVKKPLASTVGHGVKELAKDTLGELPTELLTTGLQQNITAKNIPGKEHEADWLDDKGHWWTSPMVDALKQTIAAVGLQGVLTGSVKGALSRLSNARQTTPDDQQAVQNYLAAEGTPSRQLFEALPTEVQSRVEKNSATERLRLKTELESEVTAQLPGGDAEQPTAEQFAAQSDPSWQQQIDEATAAADAKRAAQQPTDEFSDEDRAFMAALRGEQAQPAVDASAVGAGAAQSESPVSAPVEQPVELAGQVVPEAGQVADEVIEAPPASEYKAKQLPNGNWEVRRKGRAAFISKLKVRQKAIEEARLVDAQRPTLTEEPIRDRTPARVQQGAWMRQTPTEPMRVGQPVAVGNEAGFATKPQSVDIGGGISLRNREPSSAGRSKFNRVEIVRHGKEIGHVNYSTSQVGDKQVGEIDDAFLKEAERGHRLMSRVYPVIENWMRDAGVVKISANVVDSDVGKKVWGPLGFENIGGNPERWVKRFDVVKSKDVFDVASETTGPVSSLLSEPVPPVQISKSKRKGSSPPAATEPTVSAEKTPTVAVSTPSAEKGSGPLNMAGEFRSPKPKKEKSPVPSFDSLPSASRDKFNSAFDSADVDGMTQLLDKMNRGLRAEFERRSGVALPSTVKGTREAVAAHFKGKAAVPVNSGRYSTYPINTSQGPRIAVQNGDKPGLGDTVHESQEAADRYVTTTKERDEANAAARERDAAKAKDVAEKKAEADKSLNEYLESTGHSSMQKGKARAALTGDASRRSSASGKIYQGRRDAVVREMVADGWSAETREVPAAKEVSRVQFNRMDAKEQAAYEKRRTEAGNKTEHVLVKGDSSFVVTKAEHDYANWIAVKGTRETVATHFKGKAAQASADESRVIIDRIRRTYLSLSNGQWHVHVRLSDLRDALPDIPRDRVDSALMRMEAEKSVVFFAIGDPQDLHFADKQAALSNSVGDPRHVIYMDSAMNGVLNSQESTPRSEERVLTKGFFVSKWRQAVDDATDSWSKTKIMDMAAERSNDDKELSEIVDRVSVLVSSGDAEEAGKVMWSVMHNDSASEATKKYAESVRNRYQMVLDGENVSEKVQPVAQPETTSPQVEPKQVANVSQRGLPGLETEAEHLESIERMNLDTRANREALTAIGGTRFAEDHSTALRRLPVKVLRQLEQDATINPDQVAYMLRQAAPSSDSINEADYQEWLDGVAAEAIEGALNELKTVKYKTTTYSHGDRIRVGDEKGTIVALVMEDGVIQPDVMMDGDKRLTSYSFDDIEHVDEAREARLAEEERLRDEADALRDEEENARYLESQKNPKEDFLNSTEQVAAREKFEAEKARAPEKAAEDYSKKMADDFDRNGFTTRYDDPEFKNLFDQMDDAQKKKAVKRLVELGIVSKITGRKKNVVNSGELMREAAGIMRRLYDDQPRTIQGKHREAFSESDVYKKATGQEIEQADAAVQEYERTGPAADSDYIKEQIEGMQRTRAEIDKTTTYKRNAESERGKKRKNSKDYKRLTEIIDTHAKTIATLEVNYELANLEIERARIEDALVTPASSDHFLSGMYALHTNTSQTHRRKANHAKEAGGYRAGEADYKISTDAQSEADVYANKIMDRAKSIALADGTLNNDEATNISHEAFRDFAYWKPTSLEEFVAKRSLQQKAKRAGWKSEELDRVIGLTVDEAKAFKAEIAVAADGGADWVNAADAIIDRAKAVAKKVTGKQEADKKKADDEKAAEIKKIQAENDARKREQKRKAAVEARYWNRLKERTKKTDWEELTYQVRKGDDEKSSVTGDTFGSATLGVHENKTIPTDAEGNVTGKPELSYTVTHLPSGWSIGTYKSKADARSFAVMIEEAGLPWSEVREKDGITSEMASKAGRYTKAFDNTDLDYLNDDERAEVLKTAQPSSDQVKADHVLDSTAVGFGKTPVKDITKKLKEFADAVPEFAFNPVFTVTKKTDEGNSAELTFDNKIGFKFNLTSDYFGADASQFEVGDTVGIDLKDLGVTPITEQEMVVEKLKNVGFEVSSKGKAITAKWVLGTERQSFTVSKDAGSWSMEGKGVEGQFNGGRVITEANRFIEQVQKAGVDAANRMVEATGTGPLNPETGKELLAEANDLVMKIGKKWAGRANDITSLLTDEVVRDMARIASAYIKAGKVIFSDYVKEVMNSSPTFNRDVIKALGPNLVRAWNARRATNKLLNEATIEDLEPLISAPQEPPEEPVSNDPVTAGPTYPEDPRSYSIQAAMREAGREQRGAPPLEDIPAETLEMWKNQAFARMKEDEGYAEALESRFRSDDPGKLDNVDVMILQAREVQINKALQKSSDNLSEAIKSGTDADIAMAQRAADVIMERFEKFDLAKQRAGNIAGKALRAFQVLMRDDYSIEAITRRFLVKNAGHPLSEEQRKEVEELYRRNAELQEKLNKAMSEATQKASGDALEEAVGEIVASAPKKPTVARMNRPAKIMKKVNDAWSVFRGAVLASPRAKPEIAEIRTSANLNPEEAAADVVKAYREIGVSSLSELMEELQDHPEAKDFQSAFESAWNAARSEDLKGQIDVNDPKSLSKAARALAREFVENGMRGAQNVSQAVYGVISKEFPGVTERQVSDAISGYGQFSPASQDEVDIEMSSIRGVLQSLSKTQDVESGVPPKKTGQGRHPKSAEQRAQDRLLDAAMKKHKVKKATSPEQAKSIVDGIETRLRNQIEDMDEAITQNIKIVREKGGTEYEASTLKLIADRDAKKAEYEAHFGKEVKKLSAEKQLELALKAAEASLADWENRLATGQVEAKKKGSPPTNDKIEAIRARRDAVKAEVLYLRKLKEQENAPKPTAEELEARQRELNQRATETRLRNQLADLLERKAKGEFDPKKKRPPTPPTPAITELKKKVVAVKRDIAAAAEKVRLARRNNVEIAKDTFKALFLDSMYSVKLGFDASVIGVQGLKAIASHPVRILPKAVKAMARGWIQSLADADQVEFENRANFKNGAYDKAKLALGDKIDSVELHNINAKLPGLLQKGLKYPLAMIHASQRSARNAMNVIRAEYTDVLIEKTGRRNLSNLRANAADMLIAGASLDGTLTDEQLRNIGKDVNDLTGHGHLGVFEQAATAASQVFLSPRWLKSKFDYVTLKTLRTATKTRVEGTREVVGADWEHRRMMVSEAYGRPIIAMAALAGLAYIAKSLAGGDDDEPFMDFDPRSPKFLSMNFGNDRHYDLTAGLAKTVGFLARVGFSTAKDAGYGPGSTKGVTYGESRNDGVLDIAWRYLLGQAAPSVRNIPNTAYSLVTGKDLFSKKKVTPLGIAADQFLPMGPTAIAKMLHKSDNIPIGLTAAVFMALGANENLFEPRVKPWGEVNNYAADDLIRNWNRENPSATWAPGKLDADYTVNKVKHAMTDKQFDEYVKLSGEYAKKSADQLLAKLSPSEIKRPSEKTVQALKHIVRQSRTSAKRVVVSKTGKMPDAE